MDVPDAQPSPLIRRRAEVRRAARPQEGDLGRAIADREIEVKVQLNQPTAKSRPLRPKAEHMDAPTGYAT
jgi:hypothetical protein